MYRLLAIYLLLAVSFASFASFAEDYKVNTKHLMTITGEEDVVFVPIEEKFLPVDKQLKAKGVKGRLLISWGKITSANMETSYHRYDENGNEVSNADIDLINSLLANGLELTSSHIIEVEYYITDSLSVELADRYSAYGLAGETVGEVEDTGLLPGQSSTTLVELRHEDQVNDIQLGLNYTIHINDKLAVILKGSAGLVHIDTDTTLHSDYGSETLLEYDGLAGYSYGGGIEARFTYKSFFLQGGVDIRNYVIAPVKHDDGSSEEIHHQGTIFYLTFGLKF